MTARVLTVALDGADSRLLDQMTRSDEMPVLARLRREGQFQTLNHGDELSDDSVWASFAFGKPLSEHGRAFYNIPLATGELGKAFLDENGADAFWCQPHMQDKRIAILDIPKVPDPHPFNGIFVTDWLVHGQYRPRPATYPNSIAGEIEGLFSGAPSLQHPCAYQFRPVDDDEIRQFTTDLIASVGRKETAALHYLQKEAWDLFFVCFRESHCVGHSLWHLHDERHADFDAEKTKRLGQPVETVYKALDRALGELVEAAGEGAQVIVFSTFDVEPNGSIWHFSDALHARIERQLVKQFGSWRQRLLAAFSSKKSSGQGLMSRVVPANDNLFALQINPSADERVLHETMSLLEEVHDLDNNRPLFIEISCPSPSGPGDRKPGMPDVVARCRQGAMPERAGSKRLGELMAKPNPMRPGNHVGRGSIIASGADVVRHVKDVRALHQLPHALDGVLHGR